MKIENLRYKNMKYLIINADDFWISHIFNAEIIKLLENEILKSATVMVDRMDISMQQHQIERLAELNNKWNISIWLHLEFLDKSFESEIRRQYDKFINLLWFVPSHLDLHKLAFVDESFPFIEKFCLEKELPMRNLWFFSEKVKMTSRRAFSWTNKTFDVIENWLSELKDNDIQEILFHPWVYDPICKSNLNEWREKDRDNAIKTYTALEKHNIVLINYKDFISKNI